MKVVYDSERDMLYIYFPKSSTKVAKTVTIAPGVFADFYKTEKLIELQILEAREVIDKKIEFDLSQIESVAHS